ncbi:MAG: methyltransferase domain-containing protein [Myxococcales bacterium]|nr:methyltransferase domain-containing protein [Myxococcales bacterium]
MTTNHRLNNEPTKLLVDHIDQLPAGRALDLACGQGRNAIFLAGRGFQVMGVDRDADAVAAMKLRGLKRGLQLQGTVADMEKEPPEFEIPGDFYEVIVVVRYLWRPLFALIERGLAPGGWLIYETFTTDQAKLGKPTNPDFLLKPGELKTAFPGLKVLHYEEGTRPTADGGREAVASLVARKPAYGES